MNRRYQTLPTSALSLDRDGYMVPSNRASQPVAPSYVSTRPTPPGYTSVLQNRPLYEEPESYSQHDDTVPRSASTPYAQDRDTARPYPSNALDGRDWNPSSGTQSQGRSERPFVPRDQMTPYSQRQEGLVATRRGADATNKMIKDGSRDGLERDINMPNPPHNFRSSLPNRGKTLPGNETKLMPPPSSYAVKSPRRESSTESYRKRDLSHENFRNCLSVTCRGRDGEPVEIFAALDSHSPHDLISESLFEKLGDVSGKPCNEFFDYKGEKVPVRCSARVKVCWGVCIDKHKNYFNFQVVPDLGRDMVFGIETYKDSTLEMENHAVSWPANQLGDDVLLMFIKDRRNKQKKQEDRKRHDEVLSSHAKSGEEADRARNAQWRQEDLDAMQRRIDDAAGRLSRANEVVRQQKDGIVHLQQQTLVRRQIGRDDGAGLDALEEARHTLNSLVRTVENAKGLLMAARAEKSRLESSNI